VLAVPLKSAFKRMGEADEEIPTGLGVANVTRCRSGTIYWQSVCLD